MRRLLLALLALFLLTGPVGPLASAVAEPVRIETACPYDLVPLAEYGDVDPMGIHARAIDCLAYWGIASGEEGDFSPDEPLTGAELDTWLARVPGRGERAMAAPSPPGPVSRAMLASVLVGDLEARSSQTLAEGKVSGEDVASSPHRTAIAKAVGSGLVLPVGGDFAPQAEITRAEGATYVARALAVLVEEEILAVPDDPAYDVPPGRLPYLPLPPAEDGAFHLDVDDRADGTPIRFNPCRPVPVVANLDGAHPGAEEDLVAALALISEAMGAEWVYEGTTDEQLASAYAPRSAYQPSRYGNRWAPVLVTWPETWVNPMEIALAGSKAIDEDELVTGEVRINREAELEGSDLLEVLMHELGHVAGLGHVDGHDQIMRRTLQDGSTGPVFQDGDRAGLAVLGRASGCFRSALPG
jgi:hypothetical protein